MLKIVFFLMHQINSTLPFQMRMTDLMQLPILPMRYGLNSLPRGLMDRG